MSDSSSGGNKADAPGPGAQRAAAVLLGLGRETAAQVFRLLDEATIRQIALGARELRKSPNLVRQALETFVVSMDSLTGDATASDGLLREIASRALGPEAARRAFEGVSAPPPVDEMLGPVAQADAEALAMILAREQPQTVALVLGSLEQSRAGMVLKLLPDRFRPQVLRRLATLESVAPEVLREVGQALQAELRSASGGTSRRSSDTAAALPSTRRLVPPWAARSSACSA